MLVGSNEPAPSSSQRAAHSTQSRPVPLLPPLTTTSNPDGIAALRRPSMATTTRSPPNATAASRTNPGSFTAALFIDTFATPTLNKSRMSSSDEIPPPTVSGMSITAATLLAHSTRLARPSNVAAMSSIASSSAPSAS